jgi:O-antigen/teichoic acid export membrane protein
VGVTAILILIQTKADILLIDWRLGPAAAGAFGAVAQVHELVTTANGVLMVTAGPLLARSLGRADPRQFQAVFQRFFDGLVLVLPGAAVVGSLLAGPLVSVGFGADYTTVTPELRILVWAGALLPVAELMGVVAVTLNLQRQLVRVELISLTITVTGNLLLLGIAGTVAAAWIRLFVYLMGLAWAYAIIRTHSPYRLSCKQMPLALLSAGVAAGVTGVALLVHPLLAAAAGVGSYALSVKTLQAVVRNRAPFEAPSGVAQETGAPG